MAFRIVLLVAAMVILFPVSGAAAPAGSSTAAQPRIPHEDPTVARDDRDATAPMLLFGDVLALLRSRRYEDARVRIAAIGAASWPGDLEGLARRLGRLTGEVTAGLEEADRLVSRAVELARAGRYREAEEIARDARRLLRRSGISLMDTQGALKEMADRLGIPGMPENAPPRQAFARVEQVLRDVGQLREVFELVLRDPRRLRELFELGATAAVLPTRLSWLAPDRAYPGRPFPVSGTVSTPGAGVETGAVPTGRQAARQLRFTLNGRSLGVFVVSGTFALDVLVPPDVPPGEHMLTAEVLAAGRLAGASSSRPLRVVLAPSVISLQAPSLVRSPGVVDVEGRLRSGSDAVSGAEVRLVLGDAATTGRTRADGSFRLSVSLPAGLAMVGPQDLVIVALPTEPWIAPACARRRIFVVNMLSLGLLAAAVAPLVPWYARTRRKRRNLRQDPSPSAPRDLLITEVPGTPLLGASWHEKLLRLYADTVHELERAAGVRLGSSMTLREFRDAVLLRLDLPAFAEMTALAEKALYSRTQVGPEMLTIMHGLRRDLMVILRRKAFVLPGPR
jgi:hypothetical protein